MGYAGHYVVFVEDAGADGREADLQQGAAEAAWSVGHHRAAARSSGQDGQDGFAAQQHCCAVWHRAENLRRGACAVREEQREARADGRAR